ncbi:MAG TPA: methionyl-tRNA formyltransferase [Frankiaceae bacterium]|jgi:methionyl-tRNA formyltransferase|nr:methionyl-tRNA formyltransferase [Frankiaceae bacterium]
MRLVFAGTPAAALPSLRALLDSDRHEVVAVLTRPDAPAGRGRKLGISPVKQLALEAELEILTPQRPREPEFLERLAQIAPDCCPVVAYGALLPKAALDIPLHGWVNLHFSLLPAWRGAAPVQHALLAGDDMTGATTFRLEEGMDTGPYFGMVTEPIASNDTSGDLLLRLSESGARLLTATLDGIEDGTLEARVQPGDGVSLAPKFAADDARIRWHEPAVVIDRLARAATPAPGAWTTFRDRRLKVGPVRPTEEWGIAPGELAERAGKVLAGTATVAVELASVQPEGKPPMSADAWARGIRLQPGDRLA